MEGLPATTDSAFRKAGSVTEIEIVWTGRMKNAVSCSYILFAKLPWPGNSEGTFQSSS